MWFHFFSTFNAQMGQTLQSTNTLLGTCWLIGAFLLLLCELFAPGLFLFISFGIGCFAASTTAFYGGNLLSQYAAALLGLAISFWVLNRYNKNTKKKSPEFNSIVGKKALVIKAVYPNLPGIIKVQGEEWPALPENSHQSFEPHSHVTIVAVRGNKAFVK